MNNNLKITGISSIPYNWNILPIKEILIKAQLGGNYENGESERGLPLIKMGNIGRGKINVNKIEYIPEDLTYSNEYLLNYGDLLLNTRNTLDLVGKVSIWRNELAKALFNSNLLRLTFDRNFVACNEFMNYVFNSEYGVKQLRSFATGTTSVAAIYSRDLLNFKVILPSIIEQQKIAEILSTVDDKINIITCQVAENENLKQGLMQQLLTKGIGHTHFKSSELGEIPESWEVVKQGTVARFFNGRAYKLSEWEESGIPVIRLQNLTGSGKDYYYSNLSLPEHQYCFNGDLLYMWSATFGAVWWKGGKAIYHYHIWKIEVNGEQLDKTYLYYLLTDVTARMKNQSHGSTMLHVTKTGMENLKIKLPPLSEQLKICELLTAIDRKLELLQEKKILYTQLKSGLMQQLLTGKIRANTYQPESAVA
ncbi:hypothetical protein FPZ43_05895 [Mucilaginibacter pallidiroseus]|uniref:Type I restriction modification DNA specificity domain-containing protein n=1 Tax=Mucilaginibacter pallidiroseus TaxID=2599295 RepID=A0A563UGJ9_9SPHI|nr:restriction endonuclease subunit S [Mucilaginibacter pallidiroseus]TWR30471.1 hypothetical protein FPZ43_05895 [Mucilaginibacter pallidiroseus]